MARALGLNVSQDSRLLAEVARNMSTSDHLDSHGGDLFCDSSGCSSIERAPPFRSGKSTRFSLPAPRCHALDPSIWQERGGPRS